MAIKTVVKDTVSVALAGGPVFLTVTIGNAQIGASIVQFEGSPGIVAKGEISNLNLGDSAALAGKTLKVTTNVLDVNTATNGMVVTHYFHDATPPAFTYTDRVDSDGDIYSLITTYRF